MSGLGHAIRFEHRCAKRGFEIAHHLRRKRRAARSNETQSLGACGLPGCDVVTRQQKLVQGRHGRPPGDAASPGDTPERQRIEPRGHDHRPAGRQRGEQRCHEAMNVKQRHHAQRDILWTESVGACDVARRDGQVGVGERNALGPPGAAARVQDERDILDGRRDDGAPPVDAEKAHRSRAAHLDGQDVDATGGCASSLLRAVRWKQKHTRIRVFQIEAELGFSVSWIERRRGAGDRCGKKGNDRRKDHWEARCRRDRPGRCRPPAALPRPTPPGSSARRR